MSNIKDNNTRKPHNYWEEATPAQREEWAKRMQREKEEKTNMSFHAAEVKRLDDMDKDYRDFDKAAKAEFTGDNGEDNGEAKGKDPIVKTITEDILNRYRFVTIEESRDSSL
jgi:hypothetical protein